MMIETATVIAYQNGVATVQCSAKQGCGGCAMQASCGTKALSALAGEKNAPRFELMVTEPLLVGELVQIGLAEQSLLKGVLWLYGIPLASLIVSTLLLSQWFDNELLLASGMTFSLFCSWGFVKWRLAQKIFEPIFIRKLTPLHEVIAHCHNLNSKDIDFSDL